MFRVKTGCPILEPAYTARKVVASPIVRCLFKSNPLGWNHDCYNSLKLLIMLRNIKLKFLNFEVNTKKVGFVSFKGICQDNEDHLPMCVVSECSLRQFDGSMIVFLGFNDGGICSEVRVEGLETLDYFDNLIQRERFTKQADPITFDGEVDRVYLSTPIKIAIIDHEKKRTFVLRKESLPDPVVWDPWNKKAKALADFGDRITKSILCVDSAAIEIPSPQLVVLDLHLFFDI
ncbi:hypothetical protein MKX01_009809 [Papaver californicum]|nr:hypothetical protein MKX01_009809 [Papaver californicum]